MKTLIFGMGYLGRKYFDCNLHNNDEEIETIVCFLDNNNEKTMRGKYSCYLPVKVKELEYDKIIIANDSNEACLEMQAQLVGFGVKKENIVFFDSQDLKTIQLRRYERKCDFYKTFARFVKEEGIMGNIAECGVWKGNSAKYINSLYPDRKLYLFDTFEGFAQQDVDVEKTLGNEVFNKREGGFETSVDLVMSKMVFPENIILKKGRVPETLDGVDDIFCFVYLDMDLYQPMLAAMKFF